MGPELIHQHAVRHLLHFTLDEIADLERTEGEADQAVDGEAEGGQHALHLAVLAFLEREGQPDVGALHLVERGFDGAVAHALDLDAVLQAVETFLRDVAPGADAVAPRPARRRKFEKAREFAVIGEKEEALGVDVETADRDDAGHVVRQALEDRRAAFRILRGRHQAGGLVIAPEPRRLELRQRLAIDDDAVFRRHVEGRARQKLAVDGDLAFLDQAFGVAARADAGARDDFCDALAFGGACPGAGRVGFLGTGRAGPVWGRS